jgi:pimeloyl-ACP methyl ester carboxylesterase
MKEITMGKRFFALAAVLALAGGGYPAARPEAPEYGYFDSSGVRLAYLDKGLGEPVILLHGGLADSEFNWVQFGILDALAENHRTIALDLRGHGKSDKPHEPAAYGRMMARDVLALMDHLNIPKAHLLGYSLGSLIALTIIADHPERILSAAFGGPGWIREDADLSIYLRTAESLEAGRGLGPMLKAYSEGNGEALSLEELDKINAFFASRNDFQAIAAVMRGYADFGVPEERLQAAHVPCLFLFGTKDDNRDTIPLFKSALGKYASFVDIPDAAHGDAIVRPEFRAAVLRFFSPRPVSEK